MIGNPRRVLNVRLCFKGLVEGEMNTAREESSTHKRGAQLPSGYMLWIALWRCLLPAVNFIEWAPKMTGENIHRAFLLRLIADLIHIGAPFQLPNKPTCGQMFAQRHESLRRCSGANALALVSMQSAWFGAENSHIKSSGAGQMQ